MNKILVKRVSALLLTLAVFISGFIAVVFGGELIRVSAVTTEKSEGMTITSGDIARNVTDDDGLFAALDRLSAEYGWNAKEQLRIESVSGTAYGSVVKLAQVEGEYPVYGKTVNVVLSDGNITAITGNFVADLKVDLTRKLSLEAAEVKVAQQYPYAINSVAEYVYIGDNSAELAYVFSTGYMGLSDIAVSASSGKIIGIVPYYNSVLDGKEGENETVQIEQVDSFGNKVTLPILKETTAEKGTMYTLADDKRNILIADAENKKAGGDFCTSTTGKFSDADAITTYNNLIKSFDFYTDAANTGVARYGIDDSVQSYKTGAVSTAKEIAIIAYIHYDVQWANAAYMGTESGTGMNNYATFVFGDGMAAQGFQYMGTGLDVVGHEYQHAVTHSFINLPYLNASGAIDEAFSDIFGALIEDQDITTKEFWGIGEDSSTQDIPLRDMQNPKNPKLDTVYPTAISEMTPFCYRNHDHSKSNCDYGGVHTNNVILTHATYKLYDSDKEFFTKDRIGTLWFNALPLLTTTSSFSDFKRVLTESAILLGYSQEQINKVVAAYGEVGVTSTKYQVRFIGHGGQILSSQTVEYGKAATAPSVPNYTDDEGVEYEFYSWNKSSEKITAKTDITAVYKKVGAAEPDPADNPDVNEPGYDNNDTGNTGLTTTQIMVAIICGAAIIAISAVAITVIIKNKNH